MLSCSSKCFISARINIRKRSILRKISKIQLIFWYWNFVETHSFRWVLRDSSETLQKPSVSTKFTHQERWNYGILCNVTFFAECILATAPVFCVFLVFSFRKHTWRQKRQWLRAEKKWCPWTIYRNIIFQYLKKSDVHGPYTEI